MWARIDKNTIAEITDEDPKGRFHPSIEWLEVPEYVSVGYSHIEGVFIPPAGPGPQLKIESGGYSYPVTSEAMIEIALEVAAGSKPKALAIAALEKIRRKKDGR